VIREVGGGFSHVAAVAGRADAAPRAEEGHDEPLTAACAQSTGESEAENATFEIAVEFLLDEARYGPLGGFPPREPALEVLRDDCVERRLLGAAALITARRRGASVRAEARPRGKRGGGRDHG